MHVRDTAPGKNASIMHVRDTAPGKNASIMHVRDTAPGKNASIMHVRDARRDFCTAGCRIRGSAVVPVPFVASSA
jgi:hypothetical protein